MEFRSIENLTAIDRVYDEDNPIYYLVGDIIKFTYHNGATISKTIVQQDVMVDSPTEEEIKVATLAVEAKRWRDQELKNTDTLSEIEKYKTIQIICKYIIMFNNIHEDEIELSLFTNNIINLFSE